MPLCASAVSPVSGCSTPWSAHPSFSPCFHGPHGTCRPRPLKHIVLVLAFQAVSMPYPSPSLIWLQCRCFIGFCQPILCGFLPTSPGGPTGDNCALPPVLYQSLRAQGEQWQPQLVATGTKAGHQVEAAALYSHGRGSESNDDRDVNRFLPLCCIGCTASPSTVLFHQGRAGATGLRVT